MTDSGHINLQDVRLGILGGGQLAKMLIQASSRWSIHTSVLDPSEDCPAACLCNTFVRGNFRDYNEVYSFGSKVNLLTIEIEQVNADALMQLEKEGKKVFPQPAHINTIQDKGLQKMFFKKNNLPTSRFWLFEDKNEIRKAADSGIIQFPFVQKLRTTGYDGRGVAIIRNLNDLSLLPDGKYLVEECIAIEKELSVIASRNSKGETAAYPPVEMKMDARANLVEYLMSPAEISEKLSNAACLLALSVINSFKLVGVLAVEMFLSKQEEILINEVAPRPHNSGHHTIESAYTSQYEQHLRAILGLPPGSTKLISPAVMLNLLGEPGFNGVPRYSGMDECLSMEGASIHFYGKQETRPFRKMGHVTILAPQIDAAMDKAKMIQKKLKIIS